MVESTALEMRHTGNRIVGSNPTLSASLNEGHLLYTLPVVILPQVDYQKTWQLQLIFLESIIQNNYPGIFFILEHNPVFTLGRNGKPGHLLISEELLNEQGIALYEVERGGDITYHGPGQIVGYPMVNLNFWKKDVHLFLRNLEETLIQFLSQFHLSAFRLPPYTGVWVNSDKPEKIAAIGIAVKKWVTYHGFALNISTDLKPFTFIIPCGIADKGVTSLSKIVKRYFSKEERMIMKRRLMEEFSHIFSIPLKEIDPYPFEKWFLTQDTATLLHEMNYS